MFLFRRLRKVVESQKLFLYKITNIIINLNNIFEDNKGWQKQSIQNYMDTQGKGANFLTVAKMLNAKL